MEFFLVENGRHFTKEFLHTVFQQIRNDFACNKENEECVTGRQGG